MRWAPGERAPEHFRCCGWCGGSGPSVILSGAAEVEFPGAAAAAVSSAGNARAGAAKRNRFGRSGFWRSALVHAPALPSALPPGRPRDLPVARDGRGSGARVGASAEQIAVLPNPVDLEGIPRGAGSPRCVERRGPAPAGRGKAGAGKGIRPAARSACRSARAVSGRRFDRRRRRPRRDGAQVALCRSLGLETAVRFAGHVDQSLRFFPGATLFVLSSRYEGMPNALLEAAAAGLPLVATPASGGVVDLLRGRPGAWLAPEISSKALAATLVAALEALRPGERFCTRSFRRVQDHGGAGDSRAPEAQI